MDNQEETTLYDQAMMRAKLHLGHIEDMIAYHIDEDTTREKLLIMMGVIHEKQAAARSAIEQVDAIIKRDILHTVINKKKESTDD